MEAEDARTRFVRRFQEVVAGSVPLTDFERGLATWVRDNARELPIGPPQAAYAYVLFSPQSLNRAEGADDDVLEELDLLTDLATLIPATQPLAQIYAMALVHDDWPDNLLPDYEGVIGYALDRGWNVTGEFYRDFEPLMRAIPFISLSFAKRWLGVIESAIGGVGREFYSNDVEALHNGLRRMKVYPPDATPLRQRLRERLSTFYHFAVYGGDSYTRSYQRFRKGTTQVEEVELGEVRSLTTIEIAEAQEYSEYALRIVAGEIRDLEDQLRRVQEWTAVHDFVIDTIRRIFVQRWRPPQTQVVQQLRELPPGQHYPGGAEYRSARESFLARGGGTTADRVRALTESSSVEEIELLLGELGITREFQAVPEAVAYLRAYVTQL